MPTTAHRISQLGESEHCMLGSHGVVQWYWLEASSKPQKPGLQFPPPPPVHRPVTESHCGESMQLDVGHCWSQEKDPCKLSKPYQPLKHEPEVPPEHKPFTAAHRITMNIKTDNAIRGK